MSILNLYPATTIADVCWPTGEKVIDAGSPAINLMTDFENHFAQVVSADMQVDQAEYAMRLAHVRLKIVVDHDKNFVGIVTAADIAEEEVMKHVAQGIAREELTVADFLQPRGQLMVLDYQELAQSTVHDLVETLKLRRCQHALVADKDKVHLRGIISASDIARRLHIPLALDKGSSFAGIFQALKAG